MSFTGELLLGNTREISAFKNSFVKTLVNKKYSKYFVRPNYIFHTDTNEYATDTNCNHNTLYCFCFFTVLTKSVTENKTLNT